MARLDTGTDDERVRVRPTKGSRPRTKRRPDYSARPLGRVVAVDRGRFTVSTSSGPLLQAVKAREIPRGAVVIGDFVRLTGDLSGRVDTLARIAHVEERTNVLRRSLEEAEDGRGEKIIVANTDLMVIVTASANPTPRVGMVERCLVAAREAGIPALLCMTKTDLADPGDFTALFDSFDLPGDRRWPRQDSRPAEGSLLRPHRSFGRWQVDPHQCPDPRIGAQCG